MKLARVSGSQPVTAQYLVGPDGTINLRQYGLVHVAGLTVADARLAIQKHLAEFVKSPDFPWTWWPSTAKSIMSSSRARGAATA